jgi:transposase
MGAPYSQDLRDRVLAAYDRGMRTKQIAEQFSVSPAWARRVKQRHRESGETRIKADGRGNNRQDRFGEVGCAGAQVSRFDIA